MLPWDGLCCGCRWPFVHPVTFLLLPAGPPSLSGWRWVWNLTAYLGAGLVWVGPVSDILPTTSVPLGTMGVRDKWLGLAFS